MTTSVSRRLVLHALGLGGLGGVSVIAGCARTRSAPLPDASAPLLPTVAIDDGDDAPPPLVCEPTTDNLEGPFFKAGAPHRASLADASTPGMTMSLGGRIVGADCRPISGAILDVWHADATGAYDHSGWKLRGRLTSDGGGRWHVDSIVPGRYLNGARYRPRHVHIKVQAAGHRSLTTQLYFPGDPYNDGDPWFVQSLLLTQPGPSRDTPGFWGSFDIALEAA